MTQVDLSKFSNKWYKPGNFVKRALWYLVNSLFFKSSLPYPSKIKVALLRMFGAKVGRGVFFKPCVNIKYPWFLEIGNHSWIGEGVWIDNLTDVKLGNNVCISQGTYLCTGSHNYEKSTFDLIVKPIIIEDGVWIGAKATILPGSKIKTQAVIGAGAIFSGLAKPYSVYFGNPATFSYKRTITD
uniref:Colanic acid biosynthesis acetyltransferase WcaF n=1 Tax=candidate division WOR-3 bacterium TaxID=2052148 RepID=A0A7V1EII9_UNCW3